METKKCKKCNSEKKLCEFRTRKDNKSGYGNNCKECEQKVNKEYRKFNKDKIKEYAETHKEKLKEYIIQYRTQHKEKLQEYESQKIQCECGLFSDRKHLQRHKRTERHNELMNNLSMS